MTGTIPFPFIFVHIPKCAGTSVETALLPLTTGCHNFKELTEEQRTAHWLPGRGGRQHGKLRWYEMHLDLSARFKFAFVRNPWDRAVSQISYLKRNTGNAIFCGANFKENVKIYCSSKRKIWAQDLGACQVDFLKNRAGEVTMDYIGKFENLHADFATVCRRLGMSEVPTLPHVFNSQRKQHYRELYDAESAEWVRQRFQADITAFNYSF